MSALALAAAAWVLWHIGVSGTGLRDGVVARLGAPRFQGVFSIVSALLIVLLSLAYARAPSVPLWTAPGWLLWLLALLMLPAFVLFVGALTVRNPTLAGPPGAAGPPVARGMVRVTRHPMLNAFGIWAAVHLLGNGDLAGMLFFGSLLLTVVAGMPSIDTKVARRDPAGWAPFARATSILPFAAIAQGRNRLDLAEIGWMPPAIGAAVWLLLLLLHPAVFGVSPLP